MTVIDAVPFDWLVEDMYRRYQENPKEGEPNHAPAVEFRDTRPVAIEGGR